MIPEPPGFQVDQEALDRTFPWVRALRGCPQDPAHHAEGDVREHVGRVLEALAADPAWRRLARHDRESLYWAALLHDVAKPATTVVEDGRVRSPGHAARGAAMARRILWEAGLPPAQREQVCGLVLHHALPLWLVDRDDPRRPLVEASHRARGEHLALLAEADVRGRECPDAGDLLARVDLFRQLARDEGCLEGPRRFASDHGRFLYFREEWRDPDSAPFEGFRTEVVVLSGLPGAGKDTWARTHLAGWPVVSLDDLRERMGVGPGEDQGRVVEAARRAARDLLRSGTRLAWNATNVTRSMRRRVVDLAHAYGARVRIVHLEADPETLWERNRTRRRPVPARVLDRLVDRWEPPAPYEGHTVDLLGGREAAPKDTPDRGA